MHIRRCYYLHQVENFAVLAEQQRVQLRRLLRSELGPSAMLITPGVRPAGADAGDQKRVATPRQAIVDGADAVVVGRPIRDAADPLAAAWAIARELEDARRSR